jgi:hypothetical protein
MNIPDSHNENEDFSQKALDKTENQINKFIEETEVKKALVEIIDSKLKEFGIEKSKRESVEFFFFADSENKANKLKTILEDKYDYEVYGIHKSKDKWSVTGCTPVMSTKTSTIQKWSMQMCDLAFEQEVDFDGWGMLC